MSKFPFMPVDVDAYFGATRHLTTEQHGAYLLLLMEAWRRPNCVLPDDDDLLAAWAGLSVKEWKQSKSLIMAFWTLDKRSKGWTQKRLKKERKYAASVRQKKRDAAASRWKKDKKDDASAKHLSPSLSPSEESIKFDPKKWFGEKDVAFLEACHPEIEVRRKLAEPSFRDWAFKQNKAEPTRPAKKAIEKLARQYEAQETLLKLKEESGQIQYGDMSHLQAALDNRSKH